MPDGLFQRGQVWYADIRINGRRIKKSLGKVSLRQAKAERARLLAEAAEASKKGLGAVATWGFAVNRYIDAGGEERYLAPITEALHAKKLIDIKQADIDELARRIYPAAKSSTLNRQVYTPVSAVFEFAHRQGFSDKRSWSRPKGHNARKADPRWLWPSEVEKCLSAAPDDHWRAFIALGVGTGMREAELLMLRREDVDLPYRELISWVMKKGQATRLRRAIPQRAARLCEGAATGNSPEFLRLKGRYGAEIRLRDDGGGVTKGMLAAIAKTAEIPRFSAHDLRHTFATWHYAESRDLIGLREAGGWSSVGVIERYAHMATGRLADEMARHGWSYQKQHLVPNRAHSSVAR